MAPQLGGVSEAPYAQARVRARARLAATLRNNKIGAVVVETADSVRTDLAGSWLLRHHPPSLAEAWERRRVARELVPGGCETPGSTAMWMFETGWRHVMLLPYGLVFGYLWLLYRAVTGVPTVLITAALLGLWFNHAGGAR
jgi:hypothetical protein